ncbi:MAG: 2-(1,2-epoxy-1,2-dihydrophenyl)acetyl-CoA isomerase PaaG [Oligoflexia bacterium]|nr:2-(1,2-epoxy-1,2-dihydrophenyl)acetyl-CoA isomerase PaaG [Oligoflexia bacterium]
MAQKFIATESQDGVYVISFNRPDVLNSFNREMALEVQSALESAAGDSQVRALLITGHGRAFCAGQDLADVAPAADGSLPNLGDIVRECYNPIVLKIRSIEKPVIAAVNGVAAGAGANLALACDIVLAASSANFIQSFCKVGLIPDSGGTYLLPRLIGLARANALAMLGEKLSAAEAFSMGLIYRVCEPDGLMTEALTLARRLAQQPTKGLGLTKRAFNAAWTNSIEAQLTLEGKLQEQAGRSHDYAEGVTAFLQKRSPKFRGE